jgi:hypothetical protein
LWNLPSTSLHQRTVIKTSTHNTVVNASSQHSQTHYINAKSLTQSSAQSSTHQINTVINTSTIINLSTHNTIINQHKSTVFNAAAHNIPRHLDFNTSTHQHQRVCNFVVPLERFVMTILVQEKNEHLSTHFVTIPVFLCVCFFCAKGFTLSLHIPFTLFFLMSRHLSTTALRHFIWILWVLFPYTAILFRMGFSPTSLYVYLRLSSCDLTI